MAAGEGWMDMFSANDSKCAFSLYEIHRLRRLAREPASASVLVEVSD